MIRSSSSLALVSALVGSVACGGTTDRPAGRPLSAAELDAWGGAPAPQPEPAPGPGPSAHPAAIELAGGDRFQAFVALVVFDGGAQPVCAVYALRAAAAGLEEGRHTIDCPEAGLASVEPGEVRYVAVEAPRLDHLEAALAGARPIAQPSTAARPGATERIAVRLVTTGGTIEGPAAPPTWPSPVEGAPEPNYEHAPRDLSELYEAVMFPHRFAQR